MTEPQDFESLDELFRKTFEQLPENASPSGWDRPSERVWQHIQTTVQPPRSGWSARAITMVAALAVTIVVGLYLFVNQPAPKIETPAVPETVVVTAPPQAAQPAVEETTPTTPPAPVTQSTSEPRRNTAVRLIRPSAPAVSTEVPEEPARPAPQRASLPLPGINDSETTPPNTTVERKRLEELKIKPFKPLPVLPEKIDHSDFE